MKLLLMLLVTVSTASCFKESTCVNTTDGAAEILLRLRTPGGYGSPTSRGLTFADENTINDVYVLVFDKAGKLTAIREGHDVNSQTTDPAQGIISGTGSFKFTVKPSQTSLDTYNLTVLVNAGAILGATIGTTDASSYIGSSYDNVMNAIHASIDGPMYVSGGAIPMWGESGQMMVKPSASGITIQLMRSIARIDVGVGKPTRATSATTDDFTWNGLDGDGNPIPFKLTEVYLIRPNDSFSVIPVTANLTAGNPTVPMGAVKFDLPQSKTDFVFKQVAGVMSDRGGWITRGIYAPEADVVMNGEQGDANHTSRMAVVVGGSYDGGATTYYRLDFAYAGKLMNVLRNYLYQFNISKVQGPGYPTVDEAYNSLAINMIADILKWNEFSAEIYDDGTNWIRLWVSANSPFFGNDATKTALLFRNEGSTDRIRFMTSMPVEAMKLELDNGGAVDSGNPLLIRNERFSVEVVTADSGETYFQFTALKAYDAAATDNPSVLTVTLGRITFAITITQRTNDNTDWIDGGEIPKDL